MSQKINPATDFISLIANRYDDPLEARRVLVRAINRGFRLSPEFREEEADLYARRLATGTRSTVGILANHIEDYLGSRSSRSLSTNSGIPVSPFYTSFSDEVGFDGGF